MAATKRVDTATLIRGQLYTLRHPKSTPKDPIESLRFQYGVPVVIDDPDILATLEDLEDETIDGEGEMFSKPIFRIDRNVPAPEPANYKGPTKLSSDRVAKKRPRGPVNKRRRV